MRQKAADRTTRNKARQQWPVRTSLVAASAVAALGALAACSAGVSDPASLATSAAAQPGTAAVSNSVQGLGVPAVISRAIASGRAVASTGKATHKPAAKNKPKAKSSASASSSASSTTAGKSTPPPTSTTPPNSTPTGGQGGGDPSGQDPASSLSGFTLRYTQEFNGGSAPSGWNIYDAVPGGYSSSVAQWIPSMCTFSGGEAHFMASGIDSCGMKYLGEPQEYGAWFARIQSNDQPSNEFFSNIFLLWPDNLQWPPEIDIYEDRGDRSRTYASLINTVGDACGSAPTFACLLPYEQTNGPAGGVANNGTDWHTYGLEWTPSGVSWLIDGNVIFTAPASQTPSGAQQPALAMDMAVQSENLQGGGTPSTIQTMALDWVQEYTWNG
jgi:hypothetical protein